MTVIFLTLWKLNFSYSVTFASIWSPANAFNIAEYTVLSFDKDLRHITTKFSITFTHFKPFSHNASYNNPDGDIFRRHGLVEGENAGNQLFPFPIDFLSHLKMNSNFSVTCFLCSLQVLPI